MAASIHRDPSRQHFLKLPYDIRHLIYEHAFPPGPQLYIQVEGTRLIAMTPSHRVPTCLALANRQLNTEASDYLYNSYLFNLVGVKRETLVAYKHFLATVKKYSRSGVRVDAFGNGRHAATICISIQSGEAKVPFMVARDRGEKKTVEELEGEVRLDEGQRTRDRQYIVWIQRRMHLQLALCTAAGVSVLIPFLGLWSMQYAIWLFLPALIILALWYVMVPNGR